MSKEFWLGKELIQNKRALVLIQGTGEVRAGIWARSVCINENLALGSMLPFLETCKNKDIPVIVMNPNYNRCPQTGHMVPYSHTMSDHASWVWDKYVRNSGFDEIYVVAHSAGGMCLNNIINNFGDSFF